MNSAILRLADLRSSLEIFLEKAYLQIDELLPKKPTTIGITLRGGGDLCISANIDDDESFQCEMIEDFTHPMIEAIADFPIGDVQAWQDASPPVLELENHTHVQGEFEDVYQELFTFIVEASKDYCLKRQGHGWLPNRIVFEEAPWLCTGDEWFCPGGIPLPPQSPISDEPVDVCGFEGNSPEGLKVYKVKGNARKYQYLFFSRSNNPPLNGIPIASIWKPGNESFTLLGELCRDGELWACKISMSGDFALNPRSPSHSSLVEYFRTFAEFLPIEDNVGRSWELIHVLRVADLLDSKPYHFEYSTDRTRPYKILRHEFNAERLREHAGLWFKLSALPSSGTYFCSAGNDRGFIDVCQEFNFRGIEFELVWCDNTEFLARKLAEFKALMDQRLLRVMGSADVKSGAIRCVPKDLVHLWSRAKKVNHHSDLKGCEGLLCTSLPKAVRLIKRMEHRDSHLKSTNS